MPQVTSQAIEYRRPVWIAAAVAAAAAVLLMTLWPDATINTYNFIPLREHGSALACVLTACSTAAKQARFLVVDVIGNVVVFVPIGFALAGALSGIPQRRRIWFSVSAGALLSLFIETVQFQIATRATDIDDLLFNTLGTAVGVILLVHVLERWRTRQPSDA